MVRNAGVPSLGASKRTRGKSYPHARQPEGSPTGGLELYWATHEGIPIEKNGPSRPSILPGITESLMEHAPSKRPYDPESNHSSKKRVIELDDDPDHSTNDIANYAITAIDSLLYLASLLPSEMPNINYNAMESRMARKPLSRRLMKDGSKTHATICKSAQTQSSCEKKRRHGNC